MEKTLISTPLLTTSMPKTASGIEGSQFAFGSKQLNLKDFQAGSEIGLDFDLAALAGGLPIELLDLNLPLQDLQGMELPPELAEQILGFLNNLNLTQQLGVDQSKLDQLKGHLENFIATGDKQGINLTELNNLAKKLSELDFKEIEASQSEKSALKEFSSQLSQLFEGQKFKQKESDWIALPNNRNLLTKLNLSDGQLKLDSSVSTINPQQPSNTSPVAKPYIATAVVDTAMGKPQWQEAFNSRVVMLAQGQNQVAKIQINPAELGPVEIRLNMNSEGTHIQFISQHSQVREVIEDAFPKLRDMMSQSGVNLGDVNVSDQRANKEFSEQTTFIQEPRSFSSESDSFQEESTSVKPVIINNGLVDQYV